ncbi:hypothetical protein [Rhizobium hidalgonense]|nr:hypothetical protein [Rhizobium hidalgonense]
MLEVVTRASEDHLDLNGHTREIGLARSNRVRGADTIISSMTELA